MLITILSGCISGEVAVRKFTKPDFNKYPDLVINTENVKIYDFSEPKKITYYYSIIETKIPFTIGEKKFIIELKDVAYDKEGEEYAMVEIRTVGLLLYGYLYQGKETKVELFDEKIKLEAESIIDHDNIEYLTIKGVDENIQSPPEIQEATTEEDVIQELQPEETTHEESAKKHKLTKLEIIFSIISAVLLLILIITFIKIQRKSKFS